MELVSAFHRRQLRMIRSNQLISDNRYFSLIAVENGDSCSDEHRSHRSIAVRGLAPARNRNQPLHSVFR